MSHERKTFKLSPENLEIFLEIKIRLIVHELQKDKCYGTVTAFKSHDNITDSRTYHFRKQKTYIIIDDDKKLVQKVIGKA